MNPLFLRVFRSPKPFSIGFPPKSSRLSVGQTIRRPIAQRWICQQCRQFASRRSFSSSEIASEQQKIDDATADPKSLPSQAEGRRSHFAKRFSHLMDHMQSNIFIAGQRLNDLTGYSGIEALKRNIEKQEKLVESTRVSLQNAKQVFSAAIAQRSASQREVNELLQRKNAWSPQDLERFTSLYRSDHENELSETSAQEAVAEAERATEAASAKLGASILARYHEEQIWSDKIRRMSTWGTWGLMGLNVLLFIVFQIGVEPWRRKRLVKGFEEKVVEALEKEGIANNAAIASLQEQAVRAGVIAGSSAVAKAASGAGPSPAQIARPEAVTRELEGPEGIPAEVSASPGVVRGTMESYKHIFQDHFSERAVVVRRVDLTSAALEGAFAGMAFTAIVAALVSHR